MNISCDCGSFKAKLSSFPRHTPGRLVCYCNDCQTYLQRIKRSEILDQFGGTEIIPAYPKEVALLEGADRLTCYCLGVNGMHRWVASCCNSPIANTRPKFPWVGIVHSAYTRGNPDALKELGAIKSRIFGRDALDGAPYRISNKVGFRDMMVVMPFIIKGKIKKMDRESPFYTSAGTTPICEPVMLDGIVE